MIVVSKRCQKIISIIVANLGGLRKLSPEKDHKKSYLLFMKNSEINNDCCFKELPKNNKHNCCKFGGFEKTEPGKGSQEIVFVVYEE
jgi:hypothetical protein